MNHIIGYSEILLEDASDDRIEVRSSLADVHTIGKDRIRSGAADPRPRCGSNYAPRVGHTLRTPACKSRYKPYMRHVSSLLARKRFQPTCWTILRINSAASELLAFALGQPPKEAVTLAPIGNDEGPRSAHRGSPSCSLTTTRRIRDIPQPSAPAHWLLGHDGRGRPSRHSAGSRSKRSTLCCSISSCLVSMALPRLSRSRARIRIFR
jgi:hypothetical protein